MKRGCYGEKGEILEIETDKVNQVLYAPAESQMRLTVYSGQKIQVGQVIGSIEPLLSESSQVKKTSFFSFKQEEKSLFPPLENKKRNFSSFLFFTSLYKKAVSY